MFGFFRKKRLKVTSASVTDRGLVRRDNQDSLLEKPTEGLFCVADGMGGGSAGEVASGIVCEEIAAVTKEPDFDRRIVAVDDAILRANTRINDYASEHGFAQMGSTVAALLIDPNLPARAAVVHLGDSRVYRRRGIRLERLTSDHRTSEYSHFLTQAVGGRKEVTPDWLQASVQPGDIWLICSDGVSEMLPDTTINALIAHGGTPADIVARIEKSVVSAGARDNYSIVVIKT